MAITASIKHWFVFISILLSVPLFCAEIGFRYFIATEKIISYLPENKIPNKTVAFVQGRTISFQAGINSMERPEVWLVGSSAIIDGVDINFLQTQNPKFYFKKLAVYDLTIQDLPMAFSLRNERNLHAVIFFYQLGSFKEPTFITGWYHHWSLLPYLGVFGWQSFKIEHLALTLKVGMQSISDLYRYRHLINALIYQWQNDQLGHAPYTTMFDYADKNILARGQIDKLTIPEITPQSYKNAYIESINKNSRGYKLATNFLGTLSIKKKKLLLIEAPQIVTGVEFEQAKVQNEIVTSWAQAHKVPLLKLAELPQFRNQSNLFIDHKHLLPSGTELYTKDISPFISKYLRDKEN